ncbi:MAG: glycosyltransferase family 4 protein [Bacteroidales bacterium]|nr:glycosyltransferase family 4 protein [Bacteroidales bacterium]
MIFVAILLLLVLIELAYFYMANRFNIIDKPNLRSSHKSIVLRGGGIIFLFGAWLYSIFFGLTYPWFLLGLTLVGLVSFIDDIRSLPDSVRLIVQFTAMFMMFYQFGILNPHDWWMVLVALIVCVGIINAYNFMDGINGITGGYSIAVIVPLIYLNSQFYFINPQFLYVIGLSLLVFCFFNFRKKAKCFAGDVGSISIAFILLFALGLLILKTQDFSYIVFLAVYGADSILTICHRIKLHENLGEAHRKHAYQIMANELKIPHTTVSSFYMSMQLIISAGLIYLPINHYVYLGTTIVVLAIAYLVFMKKYYHLHNNYLKSKTLS